MAMASVAHAGELPPIERWGGSVGIASDYVYRGVSLSDGRYAWQGSLFAGVGKHWSAGLWASTVENQWSRGSPFEVNAYLAYAIEPAADVNIRTAWTHYAYFGPRSQLTYDYDELSVSIAYRSRWILGVSFMPNAEGTWYGDRAESTAWAADVTAVQPLYKAWSGTVGGGYYDVSGLYSTGYAYWHAGVTGSVGAVDMDLLYLGSDHHAERIYGQAVTGSRWSAALRWRF
jgi:uncharacterized protein (TIGR02001 family)